jgi:class 3 adenylate cyclase
MTQERAQRRLAAILAADVVGYSRLMEADEAGTLAALKERRKTILEPTIRSHGGRIVQVMGDGVLVEFGSAVNAVNAAVELQQKMANANETISDDRHIVLRIGINLGDIIGEGSDVYGDGVNIAARLEALSEPLGSHFRQGV